MIIVGDQSHPVDFSQLDPAIRMNKFPTTNPLTRKDQMSNNFRAMQKKFGKKYFAFMPETFNFPSDARQLKLKIKKYNNSSKFIGIQVRITMQIIFSKHWNPIATEPPLTRA